MKTITKKLPIVLGITAFVGVMLTVTMLNTTTAQTGDMHTLPVDEYKSLYKSRGEIAFNIASNHPVVKQNIGAANMTVFDFELLDSSDKLTLRKQTTRTVSGDWHNGYVNTYRGGMIIEVLIDRNSNAVISVQVTPMPDSQKTMTFTDNQTRVLRAVFNDDRVKSELQGLVDGKDYWVQMVRDYEMFSREREGHPMAATNIYSPDGKKLLVADYDLITNEVFRVVSNFREGGQ